MCESFSHRPFPRKALISAAVLIGFALLAVSTARISGLGVTEVPLAEPVESRDLRFMDRQDGAVLVYAAGDDQAIDVLEPGTNGFVRGVMRSVARERKRQSIGSDIPVRLTLWQDGRLSLEDPTTGYRTNLEAFGPTNVQAFARFLSVAQVTK